jgi:hypothetical protein
MTRFQVRKKLKTIGFGESMTGVQIRSRVINYLPVACTVATLVVAATANLNVESAQAVGIGIDHTEYWEQENQKKSVPAIDDNLLTEGDSWILEDEPDDVNVIARTINGRDLIGSKKYRYEFNLVDPVSVLANVGYLFGLDWFMRRKGIYRDWETTSYDFGSSNNRSYRRRLNKGYDNGLEDKLTFEPTGNNQPVPEPITILGTLAAGGIGVALRRKSKKQAEETVEI